ncbi:MAG: hypothetical protein J6K29_05705 [Clostridia bacterium]|nr:hypothetical protein [Clostridia bacterium]
MIYPTIKELTKGGEYNRYEIALATAKCARMITNEYTRQRVEAERQMTGNKETDKPLNTMIDKEVRDEKAVKLAIGRIHKGEYTIVHKDPALQEQEEQAVLAGINRPYDDFRPADDEEEDTEIAGEEAAEDEAAASDEEYADEETTESAEDGDLFPAEED